LAEEEKKRGGEAQREPPYGTGEEIGAGRNPLLHMSKPKKKRGSLYSPESKRGSKAFRPKKKLRYHTDEFAGGRKGGGKDSPLLARPLRGGGGKKRNFEYQLHRPGLGEKGGERARHLLFLLRRRRKSFLCLCSEGRPGGRKRSSSGTSDPSSILLRERGERRAGISSLLLSRDAEQRREGGVGWKVTVFHTPRDRKKGEKKKKGGVILFPRLSKKKKEKKSAPLFFPHRHRGAQNTLPS